MFRCSFALFCSDFFPDKNSKYKLTSFCARKFHFSSLNNLDCKGKKKKIFFFPVLFFNNIQPKS